jgi:hypothetical protein
VVRGPLLPRMAEQITALHPTTTLSRLAFAGTPRRPSLRLSSRIRAIAPARLRSASALVLPWPFAPRNFRTVGDVAVSVASDDCGELVRMPPRARLAIPLPPIRSPSQRSRREAVGQTRTSARSAPRDVGKQALSPSVKGALRRSGLVQRRASAARNSAAAECRWWTEDCSGDHRVRSSEVFTRCGNSTRANHSAG